MCLGTLKQQESCRFMLKSINKDRDNSFSGYKTLREAWLSYLEAKQY